MQVKAGVSQRRVVHKPLKPVTSSVIRQVMKRYSTRRSNGEQRGIKETSK